jgi:hypothetical protein
MRLLTLLFLVLLSPVFAFAGLPEGKRTPPPTPRDGSMSRDIDPEKFLQETFDGRTTYGTFNGFVSSLYAFDSKLQVFGSKSIVNKAVNNVFPDFYKPTVREILNMVAWQTGSKWKFDEEHHQYEFIEYPITYPFKLNLSKDWSHKYMGMYVGFAPKGSPVGMDIYYFGQITVPEGKDSAVFYRDMRKFYSTLVMKAYRASVIPDPDKEMVELTIAGHPALYWQPEKGYGGMSGLWRQWSVTIDGHAFLIVSSMEENNRDQVWHDVDEMLISFALNKNFNLESNFDPTKMSMTPSDTRLNYAALELSTTLQSPETLDKSLFIPIMSKDYRKFQNDNDLGPYLALAEEDNYDALVLTFLGGLSNNSRVLYFKGTEGAFYAESTSEKPLSIKEIRSSLKNMPKEMSKFFLHFAFTPGQLKADDGTPIPTYEVKYFRDQPQPCNPDGSPEVCTP